MQNARHSLDKNHEKNTNRINCNIVQIRNDVSQQIDGIPKSFGRLGGIERRRERDKDSLTK